MSLNAAIAKMENLLNQRNTVLTTETRTPLNKQELIQRIERSIISIYEERCSRNGALIATWIFNRNDMAFSLNRLVRKGR